MKCGSRFLEAAALKESICFSRRWSPSSFSRRWSQKLTLYFVVLNIYFCFSYETQLATQLSTKQTRAEAQLPWIECTIRIGCPVVLYRDGRTEESDVIILPNFLALAGYQIFLPMLIRARAYITRSSAIKMRVNVSVYQLRATKIYRVLTMEIHIILMSSWKKVVLASHDMVSKWAHVSRLLTITIEMC